MKHYGAQGYRVIRPSWPGMEGGRRGYHPGSRKDASISPRPRAWSFGISRLAAASAGAFPSIVVHGSYKLPGRLRSWSTRAFDQPQRAGQEAYPTNMSNAHEPNYYEGRNGNILQGLGHRPADRVLTRLAADRGRLGCANAVLWPARAILANPTAVVAMAANRVNPWPDGAAFAKVAWLQQPDSAGLVRASRGVLSGGVYD